MKKSRRFASRALAATVASLAFVLILSSCVAPPEEDWNTSHEPLWTVDADLLSAPYIAGDVVLAYAAVGDGKEAMIAWDIADGSELWRQTTLPGRTHRGIAHWVAALEGEGGWQVSVLVPATPDAAVNDYSHVAILDARTGESLADALAEQGAWAERPSVCGEENEQFCIEGILAPLVDERYDSRYVYSVDEPRFHQPARADAGYFNGGYSFTDRVAIDFDAQLEHGENGSLLWSRAYSDVFGEGASTGGGWSWYDRELGEDEPLLGVGYVHRELDLSAPQDLTSPLGDGNTVRLDRATGVTIWSEDVETCELTDYELRVHGGIAPLCRFNSGEVRARWDGDSVEEIRYVDVDVDLVGIDIDSGETAWTVPLGNAGWDGLEEDMSALRYPTGDEHIIATVDGRVTVVDVADGSVRPLSDGQMVMCSTETVMVELTSIWQDSPEFSLEDVVGVCDADGDAVKTTAIPSAAFAIAGYDLTEAVAIHTPHGLSLYPPVTDEAPEDAEVAEG